MSFKEQKVLILRKSDFSFIVSASYKKSLLIYPCHINCFSCPILFDYMGVMLMFNSELGWILLVSSSTKK